LVVSIDGCDGQLNNNGNGKFIANVKGEGKCTVNVFKKTDKGLEKQGTPQVFRVRKLPNPMVKVNAKTIIGNGEFTQGEARNIRTITIDNSNLQLNAPFKVLSFLISFGGPRMAYDEYECTGYELSAKALTAIKRMPKGGKIFIEDIKIMAPDGPRTLPPVKINVK
jgi:hypothetical protein